MIKPRSGFGVVNIFHCIYVFAGASDNRFDALINEKYDTITNEWTHFEPDLNK